MSQPIVDLKRSTWDEDASDPKKGEYVFEDKVYYRNKDFREGYIHPYKLKWCKYSENDYPRPFSTYNKWKTKYKATPVIVGDDYWPEGYIPDNENKYVDQDLVLVKIPIEVHVKDRKEAIRRADMQAMNVKKEFVDSTKKAGLDIPEEVIEEEIDRMKREIGRSGV